MSPIVWKTAQLQFDDEDVMPAIKVYKGAGAMIPLEQAKIAKAYQCPWTDNLYATKAAYTKHLRILRESRMRTRARAIKRTKLINTLWNQPSFEAIIDWIELNGEFWFDQYVRDCSWSQKIDPSIRQDFGIKILHLNMTWSPMVSNSHSCPHNGVTCWSSHEAKDGRPRGYPGWSGRIEFKTTHSKLQAGSGLFEATRIYTGTGGGGGNTYSYECKLFADDWPGLNNGQVMLDLLANKTPDSFTYGKSRWG